MNINRLFRNASVLVFILGPLSSLAELPGDSVYQLQSQWLTQESKSISLRDLAGKKVVLSMTYTSCQHTCPTIVSKMQTIQESLTDEARDRVTFVLVSLMPETDTPQVMKAYEKKRSLEKWLLLSGNNDDVRTLAMALNVKYKEAGVGEIAHSNLVTILGTQGTIELAIAGASAGSDAAIEYLQK